jgi:LytS/YehU family sensor histidine kinase
VGEGSDHHGVGRSLPEIACAAMVFDEVSVTEKKGSFCESAECHLSYAAAGPIRYDGAVVGSVVMFQVRGYRIMPEVVELGCEVAQFLSTRQMQMEEIARQAQAVSKAELKALQAQVHPHFLFNALNTVAALCEVDPARATALTIKLGEFFRSSFRSDRGILSNLQEELASVKTYLDIELARFGDRMEVEQQIDLAAMNCALPSFTLQPIVENAILHGISKRSGRRKLRMVARVKNGRLIAWVIDDGRGFDASAVNWRENHGHALAMLRSRLDRIYGANCGFRIRSRPGEGTLVCIWVPVTQPDMPHPFEQS